MLRKRDAGKDEELRLKDLLHQIIDEHDKTYEAELAWLKFSNQELSIEETVSNLASILKTYKETLTDSQKILIYKRVGTLYFISNELEPSETAKKGCFISYNKAFELIYSTQPSDGEIFSALGLHYFFNVISLSTLAV